MTTPSKATPPPRPPVVDEATWQKALDELRVREKAATRELDAIAAQRRRLPMVAMPDYRLEGPHGPVRLIDIFDGRRQLIIYNHMWFPEEIWQCGGCTSFTTQFVRLDFLEPYDARFVIVTQGPIDEALAYKRRVGNRMDWYSTANSSFGADVGAPRGTASRSTCSSATTTAPSTGPGTRPGGASSNSPTRSLSSTSSRTDDRRSGRTPPSAGRKVRHTRDGSTPSKSAISTATDDAVGPATAGAGPTQTPARGRVRKCVHEAREARPPTHGFLNRCSGRCARPIGRRNARVPSFKVRRDTLTSTDASAKGA